MLTEQQLEAWTDGVLQDILSETIDPSLALCPFLAPHPLTVEDMHIASNFVLLEIIEEVLLNVDFSVESYILSPDTDEDCLSDTYWDLEEDEIDGFIRDMNTRMQKWHEAFYPHREQIYRAITDEDVQKNWDSAQNVIQTNWPLEYDIAD